MSAESSIGTVFAQARMVWVLILRQNSSVRRSIAFVGRQGFQFAGSSLVNANSRSPASSSLFSTACHLRKNALRLEREPARGLIGGGPAFVNGVSAGSADRRPREQ